MQTLYYLIEAPHDVGFSFMYTLENKSKDGAKAWKTK